MCQVIVYMAAEIQRSMYGPKNNRAIPQASWAEENQQYAPCLREPHGGHGQRFSKRFRDVPLSVQKERISAEIISHTFRTTLQVS